MLKYTDEQVRFVLDARLTRALEWRDVAAAFSKKWKTQATPEQMRHLYRGSVGTPVAEQHPLSDFVHSAFGTAHGSNSKGRARFFVTAASPVSQASAKRGPGQLGHNLFLPGFRAVQTWINETAGELVLLPMRAHMPALRGQPQHYDPRLLEFRARFFTEFSFNDHLRALDVQLNPQQICPLTGMFRIRGGRAQVSVAGQTVPTRFNQSLIFAHSKQDMEPIPTGNSTLPRLLHTTGAITLPEYLQDTRIGRIANDTHILGGLIVEVDAGKFWIRQVQFAPDGSFCDMGRRFHANGKTTVVAAKAFRPGDTHGGLEDRQLLLAHERLCAVVKPEKTFVEDLLDGSSISHHTQYKNITRARRKFRTLDQELAYDRQLLSDIARWTGGEIVLVASNHHEFLDRYLEEGRYLRDDNHELGHRMVVETYDGVDPLRKRLDPDGKYTWLGTEDDYYVQGVQMAGHGHLGINGAKGSPSHLERAYGTGMSGHTHTPGIRGRLYTVGHSSQRRHGYNRSISTWLTTSGIVWPGGQCQLVTVIDGRFGLDDAGLDATASKEPAKKKVAKRG